MAELAREDAPAAVEPSPRIVRGTGAASAPLELASSDDEAPPRETPAAAAAGQAIEPPNADASAPGKRHIDLTASPQAEPPKRARTSESANEAAPESEVDARPGESAGNEAELQDDEAAPQREEEDAMPFSRGVAIAEIDIMRYVEIFRASGNSQLADAIEATIVTTAAQRQAALVPRPLPENAPYRIKKWRELMELRARKYRDLGMASAANRCLLEGEEIGKCGERFDQHTQWMKDHGP